MHLILPQCSHTPCVSNITLSLGVHQHNHDVDALTGKDGEGFWNLIAFKDMETRFVLSDYSPSLATISSMRSPLQPHIKTPSLYLLVNEL